MPSTTTLYRTLRCVSAHAVRAAVEAAYLACQAPRGTLAWRRTHHPNQVAIGFRLLARNLALGTQIAAHGARPPQLLEPRAFRVAQVDGLGTFSQQRHTIHLQPLRAGPAQRFRLPWTRRVVQLLAA